MSTMDEMVDEETGVESEKFEPGQIIHPFDPSKIRVENKLLTIDLLLSRIKENELELTHGFQRKAGLWKEEAQSRLIESILVRIPLPAFYMDATDDNKWLVIDGLQRLTVFKKFLLVKELKLIGLEFLADLEGKSYDEIPRNLQRRIKETQVTVYLIEEGTPPEVKFNIFKRINTGGLPLSEQEIRHALYQGKATEFLKKLADCEEFKAATQGIRDERMVDREFVLRFTAFYLTPYSDYASNFEEFLNEAMKKLNQESDEHLEQITQKFKQVMSSAYQIFGKDSFRKPRKDRLNPINKSLFEIISVGLSRLNHEQLDFLINRKELLKKRFAQLIDEDDKFSQAISFGTSKPPKVKYRFKKIEELFAEVSKK